MRPRAPLRTRRLLPLLLLLFAPALGFTCGTEGGVELDANEWILLGAAAVDVTPPLAGSAPNPAACAGASAHTGPHLLSLEEPYTDANGNGRYDLGEPFLDCPTPRANGGTRPPDGRWNGHYLGGGDCCDRLPTAVLDPLWARTIVVSDGRKTVSLTSVDNEGVFKEIWDAVRAKVRADGVTGLDEMLFSSTHDESAPDTIGINGPTQLVSGVNPYYVEFLIERTARSIEQAFAAQQPATLRHAMVRPDDLVPCLSSYPYSPDEQIGVMQASDLRGRAIATLVDYGIHAEELGFSADAENRLHISSDWHHFARLALEARFGGMAMTVAGAMGSVEMPQVYPGPRDLTPVPYHVVPGCRTIYATDATAVPYGYSLSTRARGERIASWAAQAIERSGERSRTTVVDARRTTLLVPLDNALFKLGATFGVIPEKTAYFRGRPLTRDATGAITPFQIPDAFETDVAWLRIGDGEYVSIPGEIFPYTLARDFGGPADQAMPNGAPPPPWVLARMSQPWRFVIGLGEDMIGYLFPSTNAVGIPTSLDTQNEDRFGCRHILDAEAVGFVAGDLVADAAASLLAPPSSQDEIVVGRYLWSDGTLHRSPLGEGGRHCRGPGAAFVSAPGGGAVGVWILPPGATSFDGREERIRVGGDGPWRWMSLRGRPEARPSTQTRGITHADGRRVWLDVFPDVPTP